MSESVKVTRENKTSGFDNAELEAYMFMEQSATGVRPPGFDYIGGWSVYVYQSPITREIAIRVLQKLHHKPDQNGNMTGVTEQIAIASFDEARKRMMATYRGEK
jgi:hypothetical protein